MPKSYNSYVFDFPRRRKRIAWYVEVLCAELMKQDEMKSEDVEDYWKEVNRIREDRLPFPWQRDNMDVEAREGLDRLMKSRGERI